MIYVSVISLLKVSIAAAITKGLITELKTQCVPTNARMFPL